MADWPLSQNAAFDSLIGFDSATTTIDSMDLNSSMSSWRELVASTAFDIDNLVLLIGCIDGSQFRGEVDIAIGGSGSEVPIIEKYYVSGARVDQTSSIINHVPIRIPGGQRVSWRGRTVDGSGVRTTQVAIGRLRTGITASRAYSELIYQGESADIDPGGTANTKGAWTELVASLPYSVSGGFINYGHTAGANAGQNFSIDIAIGASSSEVIVLSDWFCNQTNREDTLRPIPLPIAFPSGTRIAMRAQSSDIDATRRVLRASYGAMR